MKNYHLEARRIVSRHCTHGSNKQKAKAEGKIASLGTERNFRQCISSYLKWCDFNQVAPDRRANSVTLLTYLNERSEWVRQKTLNQERQALQLVYKQKLPFAKSLRETILDRRSYLLSEVSQIVKHQHEKNVITTWLGFFAGTRAHEPATILPLQERNPSAHRSWHPNRFLGLTSYDLYTVTGKGGLTRVIAVPKWLAKLLEARRRKEPLIIIDREILYTSYYDIGFGQSWSQSFTSASKKALGFSRGGHGLRHSYAKWRLHQLLENDELLKQATKDKSVEILALRILSEELGHFRLDIVFAYLR